MTVPNETDTLDATTEPQLPGLMSRIIGIITAPRATFEKSLAVPRVIGILAIVALLTGASGAVFTATNTGQQAWMDTQEQQSEQVRHQPLTPEQSTQFQKVAPYVWIFFAVGTFIALPIGVVIFAGIYFFVFNFILGGTAQFKSVMAVVAHASVIGAVGAIFGTCINFGKGTLSLAPASLGALLPMLPEGSFLSHFAGAIDLFRVWGVIVTAIGLSVLYRRKTINIAVVLLSIYGILAAAYAFYISR